MKYELPKPFLSIPAGVKFTACHNGKYGKVHVFTADQMQAACQAGRDSMRYEGELPEICKEDQQWLSDNPNTSDIVEWVQDYARQAIAGYRAKVGQSEPVAWRYETARGIHRYIRHIPEREMLKEYAILNPIPLYATPQPAPAAQSFTKDDLDRAYSAGLAEGERVTLTAQPLELSDEEEVYKAHEIVDVKRALARMKAEAND